MIIHNPILTGSFTVNGTDVASITSSAASLTSLNSYTASQNILNGTYATTGSNTFAGIQTVNSNLVVTGSITAQTLVVQTITSSVDFVTGSTRFGSVIGNTHQFTGSVSITGSLAVVTTGTELQVNANGVNLGNVLTDSHIISGSLTVNPNGLFVSSSGRVGIGTTNPGAQLQVAGTVEANGSLYRAVFGSTVQDADMTGLSGGNGSELQIQAGSSTRGAFLTLGGGMATSEAMGGVAFYNSNNTDGKRLRAYLVGGQEGATAGEQGSYLSFGTVANTVAVPSERMRITSGGDVFINNPSGVSLNSLTNKLSISSTTYNLFDISRFSDNAFGPNFYLVKSRNASIGGNTIVANGDNLGNITWVGANGTGFTDAAAIRAEVDGTPGASNDMPGRLVFSTTADGAGSVTERMRITSGYSVSVPNAVATTLFNITSVLTVGSMALVTVYASSGSGLGMATLIIMRDGYGGVSQAQLGTQPTAAYLSFSLSGTNLQVTAAIGAGTHTIQGTIVRISS